MCFLAAYLGCMLSIYVLFFFVQVTAEDLDIYRLLDSSHILVK